MAAAVIMVLATTAYVWARPTRTFTVTLPLVATAAALAVTLLQLVPLPVELYSWLSPGTYELLRKSFWSGRSWAPTTLDLPATCHEAAKLVILACGALLAPALYGRRRRFELLAVIAGAGALVAAAGFAHLLFGAHRSYGTFGPPALGLPSTLINPNHLAGFLASSSLVAFGAAMAGSGRRRLWFLGAATLSGTAVLLTLSRGGILAYTAALLLFGGLALARRRPDSSRRGAVAAQLLAAAATFVAASWLSHSHIVNELWTISGAGATAKTELWRPAPAMLADFPTLGIGRGAFSAVYPRYSESTPTVTFPRFENEYIQALVDWGPLPGGLLLALLAWAAWLAFAAARKPDELGVLAALFALALQNVADFSLTLPAVALPFITLLTLASLRQRERSLRSRPALAALAVVLFATAPAAIIWELPSDTAALRRELERGGDVPTPQIASILDRHPADFLLPLLVAEHLLQKPAGAAAALPWVNRAMLLAPHNADAHRLAGHSLLRLGHRKQGILELRLACQAAPASALGVIRELARYTKSVESAAELAGDDPTVNLLIAQHLLREGAAAAALRLLEAWTTPEAVELRATAHFAEGNLEKALEDSRAAQRLAPARFVGYQVEARVLAKQALVEEALAVLERGIQTATNPNELLFQKATLLDSGGRRDDALAVAQKLLERAGAGAMAARAHWLLGTIYDRDGQLAQSLRHYERARQAHPADPGYGVALARVRIRVGDLRGARRVLEEVRATGESAQLTAALAELERHEQARRQAAGNELLRGTPEPE